MWQNQLKQTHAPVYKKRHEKTYLQIYEIWPISNIAVILTQKDLTLSTYMSEWIFSLHTSVTSKFLNFQTAVNFLVNWSKVSYFELIPDNYCSLLMDSHGFYVQYVHFLQRKYSLSSFNLLGHTAPAQAGSLLLVGPVLDYLLTNKRVDKFDYNTGSVVSTDAKRYVCRCNYILLKCYIIFFLCENERIHM